MWHRLARQRGWSVREAQQKVNSREFTEWLAFEDIEPSAPQRDDVRTAKQSMDIVQTMVNLWGSKKQRRLPLKDFMLDVDQWESQDEKDRKSRVKRIKQQMYQFAKLHNRRLKQKKRQKQKQDK